MNELKKVGNIDRNGDICHLIRKIASKNYRIGEEVYRDVEEVVQLIETYTTRKELEARLDELSGLSVGIDDHCNLEWKERITQLTSQLTNNKEE